MQKRSNCFRWGEKMKNEKSIEYVQQYVHFPFMIAWRVSLGQPVVIVLSRINREISSYAACRL